MVFADSDVIQKIISPFLVIDTYAKELETLFNRKIIKGTTEDLNSIDFPCFVFVKLVGQHKSFKARVIYDSSQIKEICDEVDSSCELYISDVLKFEREFRLFIGDDRIWAVCEYTDFMGGIKTKKTQID